MSGIDIKTCHGLGFSLLRGSQMNTKKMAEIYNFLLKEEASWLKSQEGFGELLWDMKKFTDLCRLNLVETAEDFTNCQDKYGYRFTNDELRVVKRAIELADGDIKNIDFVDQIRQPIVRNLNPIFKYDYIYLDECQDVSKAQRELVFKFLKPMGRLFAVGDRCQPAGTMVTVKDFSQSNYKKGLRGSIPSVYKKVPIESLSVGDSVVAYSVNDSSFYNSQKVDGITKRPYKGDLIVCSTPSGATSKYTPNHICIASFSALRDKFCVYMMRRGDNFRIGTCCVDYPKTKVSGLIKRMRDEVADCCWILGLYDSRAESYEMEQAISGKFGLPQTLFSGSKIQLNVDRVWKFIGDNTGRALDCLDFFGKDIQYPLFLNDGSKKCLSMKRPMEVRACNLFNGCLVLPHFEGKRHELKQDWCPATISKEFYDGFVYSLSVSKYQTYVADSIVTHNCQAIYGFAGSDSESFDTFSAQCKVMSLNTCFRCPKEVIKYVNKIDPDIKAWENAKEGLVRGGTTLDNIKAGDAVLCRNNAPLIEGCYDMIAKGKKATIMGRDIGESLINFIVSFKSNSLSDLQRRMNEKRQQLIDRLEDKFPSEDAYSNPLYTKFSEQMDCITVLIFKVGTIASVDNLTTYIRRIFSDDKNPEILFSTVHRAKGLEWPNVYIIEPSLLTKRRPKDKDWQHEQATNLEYVAYTRAKETLNFVVKPKKH
jgi:hypothetical protein